jgi:hypothetical protein
MVREKGRGEKERVQLLTASLQIEKGNERIDRREEVSETATLPSPPLTPPPPASLCPGYPTSAPPTHSWRQREKVRAGFGW